MNGRDQSKQERWRASQRERGLARMDLHLPENFLPVVQDVQKRHFPSDRGARSKAVVALVRIGAAFLPMVERRAIRESSGLNDALDATAAVCAEVESGEADIQTSRLLIPLLGRLSERLDLPPEHCAEVIIAAVDGFLKAMAVASKSDDLAVPHITKQPITEADAEEDKNQNAA